MIPLRGVDRRANGFSAASATASFALWRSGGLFKKINYCGEIVVKLRCRMANLATQVSCRAAIAGVGGRLQRSRSTLAVDLPRNLGKPWLVGQKNMKGRCRSPQGEERVKKKGLADSLRKALELPGCGGRI